jgi:aspartokinase
MSADTGVERPGKANPLHFERERGVTQIEVTPGVAHVAARLAPETLAHGQLALLQALSARQVPVFMVKLAPDGISFAVRSAHVDAAVTLLTEQRIPFVQRRDLALVSTIAGAMRDLSGVIAQIYEALILAGVIVRQTGDAYNAVLCLVSGDDAQKAAAILRERFHLPAATE